MRTFYPLMLDISGRQCLVVGGGRVALRKVISLLRAGASVTAVAPDFNPHFMPLQRRISLIRRPFEISDLTVAHALVIGATNAPEVNKAVYLRAMAVRVPCNVVDCPELCSFIVPAVVRRGDVTIAVSTSGRCPRLSKYVKSRVATTVGPEFAKLASLLAGVRDRVKSELSGPADRAAFWESLFETDPLVYCREHGWPALRERIDHLIDHHRRAAGIP
jgi:siroheme synthase-like protein